VFIDITSDPFDCWLLMNALTYCLIEYFIFVLVYEGLLIKDLLYVINSFSGFKRSLK
jgi:hypothetical protein